MTLVSYQCLVFVYSTTVPTSSVTQQWMTNLWISLYAHSILKGTVPTLWKLRKTT